MHQHRPHLQYYLPRPGRAVYRPGYGLSNGDTISPPSLILTLRIPRPGQCASHVQSKTAENDEEAVETASLAQESKQAVPSPKAAEANRHAPAKLGSPTANAPTSTLHDPPPTPPPSSPVPLSEAPSHHRSEPNLSEHHTPSTPALPAPEPNNNTLLQSQEPEPERTTTIPSPPTNYTYDELIRPLANPTAPPAPGMAHLTQILQDLSRDMEPQRHRVGETEYMRQCREYNNEYDNPFTENAYRQDVDEGFGGEGFDWDTYVWQ